ncbi:MAG: family 43 glycosylhydrolase [Bifidobacterium sp.]|nr:family 43 glycosylhydrolase [Bifidobacterium sp.]
MSHAYELMCYTRTATAGAEANNEDIAASVHLAVRDLLAAGDDARGWHPLNENYGVFFAAGVPAEGATAQTRAACTASARLRSEPLPHGRSVSEASRYGAVMPGRDIELKSLRDPFIFRLDDGGFGIVATRTARGGEPDGSERSSFLLATSENLTSFTRMGQITVDTCEGVHRPRVSFDGGQRRYAIGYVNDFGMHMTTVVQDIRRAAGSSSPIPPGRPLGIASGVDRAPSIPGALSGNVMAISEHEADVVLERFGRVHNTAVSVSGVSLTACECADDPQEALGRIREVRATLQYDDGSTAGRAVEWDRGQMRRLSDDIAAGKATRGRTYRLDGTVRAPAYPVPFAKERADPSIFRYSFNGETLFLFIATEDEGGNCIDPRQGHAHMPLRVGDSIYSLSDEAGGRAREIDLLRAGDRNCEGRAMTGCFWAPELHVIGGRLSILFMPCFDGEATNPDGSENDRAGKPDMWTGCCHIMQLKKDGAGNDLDPRVASHWTVPRPILDPEGGVLDPIERISLDMTAFEDSGTSYYAWQQVGSVWIATFDPADPATLTSMPRQIVVPEFAWDNLIAEGPNVYVHDGTLFLIYSGSLVGIDYTTGLVTARAGQGVDLRDPGAWTKLDYPLQKSGVYNGNWQLGTGHGMWSHDEDGNLIYVFHNARYDNGRYGGRDAQVRRVHWSAEGMPILDMQAGEELDSSCARVTMTVDIL